jgi:hypothetical protein
MLRHGCFRTGRRAALVRWCASLLVALVLCPFTAPYASYDLNAAPIDIQDASLLAAHDKDVTVIATPPSAANFIALAHIETTLSVVAAVNPTKDQFIVLRI